MLCCWLWRVSLVGKDGNGGPVKVSPAGYGRYEQLTFEYDNGVIITEGAQVCIGGNDRYEGVCYKCYREMIRNRGKKIIH